MVWFFLVVHYENCSIDRFHWWIPSWLHRAQKYCEALYILGWQERNMSYFFETVTGVPILSASSSTGLMIFSWLLFSEKRSAQTKHFLRNLLDSPLPVKVAVAREDPEHRNVARRLQYDFLKFSPCEP